MWVHEMEDRCKASWLSSCHLAPLARLEFTKGSPFDQEHFGLRARVNSISDDEKHKRPLGRHVSCKIVTNCSAMKSNIVSSHRPGTESLAWGKPSLHTPYRFLERCSPSAANSAFIFVRCALESSGKVTAVYHAFAFLSHRNLRCYCHCPSSTC